MEQNAVLHLIQITHKTYNICLLVMWTITLHLDNNWHIFVMLCLYYHSKSYLSLVCPLPYEEINTTYSPDVLLNRILRISFTFCDADNN